MLRAWHIIINPDEKHTLLSNFQMREAGLIVDNVHKHHLKTPEDCGTHSITLPGGEHVIDLSTWTALSTFELKKSTLAECLAFDKTKIFDIGVKNWNPQDYHEEGLAQMPPVNNQQAPPAMFEPAFEDSGECEEKLNTTAMNATTAWQVANTIVSSDEDPAIQIPGFRRIL